MTHFTAAAPRECRKHTAGFTLLLSHTTGTGDGRQKELYICHLTVFLLIFFMINETSSTLEQEKGKCQRHNFHAIFFHSYVGYQQDLELCACLFWNNIFCCLGGVASKTKTWAHVSLEALYAKSEKCTLLCTGYLHEELWRCVRTEKPGCSANSSTNTTGSLDTGWNSTLPSSAVQRTSCFPVY